MSLIDAGNVFAFIKMVTELKTQEHNCKIPHVNVADACFTF